MLQENKSFSLDSYLNFVSELFDLVNGRVVLVGELPQLLLTPFRHLLQVGALVLGVTERALHNSRDGTKC